MPTPTSHAEARARVSEFERQHDLSRPPGLDVIKLIHTDRDAAPAELLASDLRVLTATNLDLGQLHGEVVDILCSNWDGSDGQRPGPEGRADAILELLLGEGR